MMMIQVRTDPSRLQLKRSLVGEDLIDALARWVWNKVELMHENETFRVWAQRTDRIACRLEILIIFDLDIYGLQKRNPGIVFVSCTA